MEDSNLTQMSHQYDPHASNLSTKMSLRFSINSECCSEISGEKGGQQDATP
jgi:hypothetical protein